MGEHDGWCYSQVNVRGVCNCHLKTIAGLERELTNVTTGLIALSPTLANDPRPVGITAALAVVAAEYASLIQDHADLERRLAEAQIQILYEQERNRNNVALACEERDGLRATLAQAREALLDSNELLDSVRDENDEGGIADQIEANRKALAALDAGKEVR